MILGTDAKETLVQTADNQTETPDGAAPASAVVTARDLTRRYGEGDTAVRALPRRQSEIEPAGSLL